MNLAFPSREDVSTEPGAPRLGLLDARLLGLSEPELKIRAREFSGSSSTPFSSRSYCYPFALVAFHDAAVGVDVEQVAHCSAEFADLICAPDERSQADEAADWDRYLTSLWSSKEALAKGLGDALQYEPARLFTPKGWRGRSIDGWRAEELFIETDVVAWVCWRHSR